MRRKVAIIAILVLLNVSLYGSIAYHFGLTLDCRFDAPGVFCAVRSESSGFSLQYAGGLSIWTWGGDWQNRLWPIR